MVLRWALTFVPGFPDVESRGRYRGGKVSELNEAPRRFDAERQRSDFLIKSAEQDAICGEMIRIREIIVDIQAETPTGLAIQAMFFADLRKHDDRGTSEGRLTRSVARAAKRMGAWHGNLTRLVTMPWT